MIRRIPAARAPQQPPATLAQHWRADLDGHHIVALHWSPDGQTLAAATADGPIGLFEGQGGSWLHTLAGHGLGTMALAWRPDNRVLASAGQDGKIRLWDPQTGGQQLELIGGAPWVERIAWSPVVKPRTPPLRGRQAVAPVVATPAGDSSLLASAAGKSLRLWDSQGTLLREYRDHPSTVADIAWMPATGRMRPTDHAARAGEDESSAILAVATYGGLTLRRPDRDEPLGRYAWQGSTLVIAWSPDGSFIATGDQDSTVHFWITRTGQDLQMWGYPTKVRELAWDPTSRYLATGGGAIVTVWDCSGKGPADTRPIELKAHEGQLTTLAFQQRRALLASGCSDGLVSLWHVGTSKRPLASAQFEAGISQLSWSPDDRFLAVGTESGDVVVLSVPA